MPKRNGYTGKIYDRILQAGFNILSAKLLKMTNEQAKGVFIMFTESVHFLMIL
ncbi:hypothetical protein Ct9H90mP29_11080 [bacterium]|nr:MAG: hypothetical protein Ct9H90mP29_11080 [bacterium]